MVQRKNQEANTELRMMLNQSEQARRELEIKVQAMSQREELIHEQFQRAKDKTEARESYFADLKRKFEEIQLNVGPLSPKNTEHHTVNSTQCTLLTRLAL